jgi:putative flippase GtrA
MLFGPTQMIRRLRDRPSGWVFLTFGTVAAGGIGWVIDVALLWGLAVGLGVPTSIAAACGLIASGVINFLVNRVVHGGAEAHRRRELMRYGALFGVNLILVAVSVPLIAQLLSPVLANRGLELLGAKVVVTAALLLANAYAYHRWVFRRTPMLTDTGAQ